ncbi:MAG: hypothetical protein GY792_05660, partial [Gammaproteobacteria bacterium]|nr:hypothetical protein [Gammaproteobacteria bacterium]
MVELQQSPSLNYWIVVKRSKLLLLTLLVLALPARGDVMIEVPAGAAALEENLRARLGLQSEP